MNLGEEEKMSKKTKMIAERFQKKLFLLILVSKAFAA